MTPEQRQAFAQARIPNRYIDGSLSAMPGAAAAIREFVSMPAYGEGLRMGRGLLLTGDDARSEEALYYTMKSAMVWGLNCAILTPLELMEILQDGVSAEDDWEASVVSCDALFVTNFNDTFYVSNPLPEFDRYRIENFLMQRLRNNKAVSVQWLSDGEGMWWSPRLLRWINNSTERFVL